MATEQSYWNNNGKYQDVQEVLWDKLVPKSGESHSIHGEIVRSLGRLWHEWGNNGNGNANDRGQVSEFFQGFLDTIRKNVPSINAEVKEVERIILNNSSHRNEVAIYNNLTNKALEFLIEEREIDLDEFRLKALLGRANDKMGTAAFYRKEAENKKMELTILKLQGASEEDIEKMKGRIEHNEGVVVEYEEKASEYRSEYVKEAMRQGTGKKVA